MELPKRIRILSRWYEIKQDEEAMAELKGRGWLGMVKHGDGVILVLGNMPARVQWDTLLHEALHVVALEIGLSEKLGEKRSGEGVILGLTTGMRSVLVDNEIDWRKELDGDVN